MLRLRPAAERGRTAIDWLDSRHTFSFGEYHDPRHMGVRSLRVINDDRVRPASGFGSHPHRDMEIVSFVLDGCLEHRDSLGNGSVIRPGEIQRMSAGTGIVHSEWNPSATESVRFLQVWLLPRTRGRAPGYEQVALPAAADAFHRAASPDGGAGAVTIDSDAEIWNARLTPGANAALATRRGGATWIQVARGSVDVAAASAGRRGSASLAEGDGAAIDGAVELTFAARAPAEVLVFDLG
jgi:redox-sensitive bicupin YhaK (pirin superfamily)